MIIIIIYITVPVTTVTISPVGDNNVVDIIEGETQTFTCTTDSRRPAAWIRWYIGGQNTTRWKQVYFILWSGVYRKRC